MRSSRGQATIEYVGALLLVAVILISAAVVIAAPGVPRTVVAKLRLGICIVANDVCTPAQAAARGLEPCSLSTEEREETGGLSFLTFRVGATDSFVAERLSNGTVLLRNAAGSEVDATTGVGFKLGPVKVGGDATGGVSFKSGKVWQVTEAQLQDLMRRTGRDPSDVSHTDLEKLFGPPTQRYREGGVGAAADLGVDGEDDLPTLGAQGKVALGRRTGKGGTTYYFDLGGNPAGSIKELVPGLDVSGRVGAEYRRGKPPVITLRASGQDHGKETEVVLTLPLRSDGDRAVAGRALGFKLSDPDLAVRELVRRMKQEGTIQRNRYETTDSTDGWDAEVALVAKLGLDHHFRTVGRKLVAADVLNSQFPTSREDCLSGSGPSSS